MEKHKLSIQYCGHKLIVYWEWLYFQPLLIALTIRIFLVASVQCLHIEGEFCKLVHKKLYFYYYFSNRWHKYFIFVIKWSYVVCLRRTIIVLLLLRYFEVWYLFKKLDDFRTPLIIARYKIALVELNRTDNGYIVCLN